MRISDVRSRFPCPLSFPPEFWLSDFWLRGGHSLTGVEFQSPKYGH
jgi:hypothetical protein